MQTLVNPLAMETPIDDSCSLFGLRLPPRFFDDSCVSDLKNHFAGLCGFCGRHILLRHGESEANIRGVACERLDEDIDRCGLTERGRTQVYKGAQNLCLSLAEEQNVIIVTSPLLRARQSAEIVSSVFSSRGIGIRQEMIISDGISERFYGDMNGFPYAAFRELVACQDRRAPFRGLGGAESALELVDRVTRTIVSLDKHLASAYPSPPTIIYCTHLMVIKAASASFKGLSLQDLHNITGVENGEAVELQIHQK